MCATRNNLNSAYITPLKIVACIALSYAAYQTHSSRFFESTVLGYEPNTLFNLVRILFPVPLTFFGSWMAITVLMGLFISNKRQKSQNMKVIGVINNIAYSDTRINNKPMFKVTVTYGKHLKTFDHMNSDIQLNFSEGDEVVIFYQEKNIANAFLDIECSIEHKNSQGELKANANFKIIEVKPVPEDGLDLYEIIGTIYRANHSPTKASIKEIIPTHLISNFIPETIIPCIVSEDTHDNYSISMILN